MAADSRKNEEDSAVAAASGQDGVRPPNSLGINLYSLALLLLMLGYFAAMFFFAGNLLGYAAQLMRQMTGVNLFSAGMLAGSLVLLFLMARAVRHLLYVVLGLVTTRYDQVPEASEGVRIDRQNYAALFEMIEQVGRQVGSPMPDEVRINHLPEPLTVELRKFGFSPQRRLVLVLSFPQLAVLSVPELKVILGHELAHFGHGDTRIIVFLSRFLISLERAIASAREHWWRWIDPFYGFHVIYYWAFSRLSAPIQRHQELRADCISAQVNGGEFAARTFLKDCLLALQYDAALASYHPEPSHNGQTSDNFFAWFLNQWRDFSPDGQDYLLSRFEREERSSFWDPDPTLAERVATMRKFPAQPAQPARPVRGELIGDFGDLEKQFHVQMYEELDEFRR